MILKKIFNFLLEQTFNFSKILYGKVGPDYGSEIMQEIQVNHQKNKPEKVQTYFFEKDWGMEHFEFLRETYGDECDLENEFEEEK